MLNSEEAGQLECWALELERRSAYPPEIEWFQGDLTDVDQSSTSCRAVIDNMNSCNNVGESGVQMLAPGRVPGHVASSPAVLGG
jgi:hypothetical protein